jgi:mannonate dehydratase
VKGPTIGETRSRSGPSRRQFGQLALAGAFGGATLLRASGSRLLAAEPQAQRESDVPAPPESKPGIKLALMAGSGDLQSLGLQMGVTHVIAGANLRRGGDEEQYVAQLQSIKDRYAQQGLTIAGVESHPVSAERIKLGVEGREQEMADYVNAIKALGRVGIKMICYNFMAGLGWTRTSQSVPERGGAATSGFDYEYSKTQGLTQYGEISEEKMWDNMEYFLKGVIPVAEDAGVMMAAHPDDPPISPLRGIARILISAENYRRVMDMVPSPVNGVTFCQANFKLMGEDIYSLAAEWCRQKKIFFVHYRDVEGTKEHFYETFHDNGPTDMGRMMKIYHENGFDGPMRPDHAPAMGSEGGRSSGYGTLGKIYAIAYMKGLMDGQGIPYS